VQTYEELAEIHETGNDGAYIRKRHNLKDAYQNEKYVKIKKDETIINLLHGPASQIIGEKKKCIDVPFHAIQLTLVLMIALLPLILQPLPATTIMAIMRIKIVLPVHKSCVQEKKKEEQTSGG